MRRVALLCVVLLSVSLAPLRLVRADNAAVTINVDLALNRHPIDPLIYGTAYADATQLIDLNSPFNRKGGNPTSRYNWQVNADNRAFDYFFESIGYSSATAGADVDDFVQTSKNGLAQPGVTIPLLGWVAKLGANRSKLASFSVAKYGAQQSTDPFFPDAGNGVRANGQQITGNDPNDADVAVDSTYQQQWVQHLVTRWGNASAGGVKYYLLDNEPSIWFSTHRDVSPTGVTLEQMRDKTIDYAGKIKDADPNAIVCGPEEWGWSGYFYSGYDQQYLAAHNYCCAPDRDAHGGVDYLPYYLDQLRQNNMSTGRRLLDYFTVHFYPQGGEFGNDTSTAMQLRRNRSTRALWDPNYTDETWINDKVKLVPRLKQWVSQYYPGTKTGLTEYNWGAEGHMNGATAQADVLGILGREGIDMAARWTTPATNSPCYLSMKIYRNYDGAKSTFGDTSVSAAVPNPDELAAFAAQRTSDGAVTVMVVNKVLTGNTPVTINLANFVGTGTAQVYQITSAQAAIVHKPDVTVPTTAINTTVPPQSITLFVIPVAMAGDTPGIYVPGTGAWFLRNANSPGGADAVFSYGAASSGAVPLSGDWNGDGTSTPGLYQPSTGVFFLRNTNAPGGADTVVAFGAGGAGNVPIVGDWDGNGTDTIGLYQPATGVFFLKNSNAPGGADVTLSFGAGGNAGFLPLAGDWDGNGTDTIGLYAPSTGVFFLRNANSNGPADVTVGYGPPNAKPLVGDWNDDDVDTIGIYIPSTGAWFLRNANTAGGADVVFFYGPTGVTPLVGNWDGL